MCCGSKTRKRRRVNCPEMKRKIRDGTRKSLIKTIINVCKIISGAIDELQSDGDIDKDSAREGVSS